jgi:hypothetical protein
MDCNTYDKAYRDYEAAIWLKDWDGALAALLEMVETRPHNTCLEWITPRIESVRLRIEQERRGLAGWWARNGIHKAVMSLRGGE